MKDDCFEVDEIGQLLSKELGTSAARSDISLVRIRAGGQNNILFRADLGDAQGHLAIKICLDRQTNQKNAFSAQKQFDNLTRVYKKAKDHGFRIIQPVCILPEMAMLVTKWVDGSRLSGYMKASSAGERLRMCEKAGAWLSAFHSVDNGGEERLDATIYINGLTQVISEHAAAPRISQVSEEAVDLLRKTAPLVDQSLIRQKNIHGDFHPGNFIVYKGDLVGLDVEHSRTDHYLHDLVTWFNHISYLTLMPNGLKMRLDMDNLNRAFLRGYKTRSGDGHLVDEKVLHWLQTVSSVSFYERYRHTGRTFFHRTYFELAAGYNLRKLSKKLSGWIE